MATKSSNFRQANKYRDAQLLVYIEPMCFSLRIRSMGLVSGMDNLLVFGR